MSISKILDRGGALLPMFQPVAQVATRLMIGIAFVLTGYGKWTHFDNTVGFFTDLGIPAPAVNAGFVATVELVGGVCLILGLGTRLAALLLSSTMVVALLTADRGALLEALSFSGKSLTDVVPLVFLVFLVWLVGYGAGPLSVDQARRRSSSSTPGARLTRAA